MKMHAFTTLLLATVASVAVAQTPVPQTVEDKNVGVPPISNSAPANNASAKPSAVRSVPVPPDVTRQQKLAGSGASVAKGSRKLSDTVKADMPSRATPMTRLKTEERGNPQRKTVQDPKELNVADALNESSPLRQALAASYLANPELQSQRQAQQAIDERVPQALSGALPNARVDYNNGRRRTRYGSGDEYRYTNTELQQLNVVQPLFRGGQTYANTKAARREVDAGQSRLKRVEQDVLLNTVTSYMDVVQAEGILELSRKNFDVLRQQEQAAGQRFEVGEDTRTDVAQSQARVAQAQANVADAESALAAARAAYRKFTGMEPPVRFAAPDALPKLPENLDGAIATANKENPTITEARSLRKAADYRIDSNVGGILPTVSLVGNMRRNDGTGNVGLDEFDQDEVLLNASIPIYQGGAEYSRVREAKKNYQQRRFLEIEAKNDIERRVISAWEQLLAARSSLVSNSAAIDAARVALEGVRQEQKYGARTTLDVLDQERELFQTETEYVRSQRDEVVAAYSLLATVGGLTAENLGLKVANYDPNENYDDVEYQFIGF